MSSPKISVILPIYNIEDYLEDALDCLLDQTFIDEIEVLMIDDGSTDNSRYIIERYALDYDNFHAFHKENEGPAMTRNFGLDVAKGEYIHFLDADDTLAHDGYEKLYRIAEKTHSDIVTSPVIRFKRYTLFDGKFYQNSLKKFDENVYSTTFQENPELIWDLFITNKLYRLDFLNKNNIRNNVGNNAYCDDGPLSLRAYLLSEDISISTDIFYYWRYREIGNPSITQKITDTKTFNDRMQAIVLSLNVVENNKLNDSMMREFYLKLLNHDLYLHFRKFHEYEKQYHAEFIQKGKEILSVIPYEYRQEINSYKKVLYKMVEDGDMEGLASFSSLELDLKKDPKIPEGLDEKYVGLIDFKKDAVDDDLLARKEEITLDGDNLIVEFESRVNYLGSDYPQKLTAKLIDDNGDEVILDEKDSRITVPIDLIKDKKHMKIKLECAFDSIKKECYLTNTKREIFESDNFDIEIGIAVNRLLVIDIRPTNDLNVEIDEVVFEDDAFKFSGVSNDEISGVYIQNVVTFDKKSYDVESNRQDDNYNVSFSIPYDDIMSFPLRKWELRVSNTFKTIELAKKFEFYWDYSYIYMMNVRNKILISSDFYDKFERMHKFKDEIDRLRSVNRRLYDKNLDLIEKNSKLSAKNKKLKGTVDEYKSRKVIRFIDKIK